MALQANPFLKVYDAVYALLFTVGGGANLLAAEIAAGNRVSYGTEIEYNRKPQKDTVTTADIPELILVDEGGNTNLHASSSGMMYKQSLGIYVSTGDWRYGTIASKLNWYILCNLQVWQTTLGALTWRGEKFVKNIELVPIQIGESNPERNRNLNGFNLVWRIVFELRISKVNTVYTET